MSIKRILSLILSISIIMTSFVTAAFAADDNTAADTDATAGAVQKDASYYRAATVLSALGIMQGKSETDFGEDDILTRAEMSAIAVRFFGLDPDDKSSTESIFNDVESSYWGKNYINISSDLGLVNGNGDGTFAPEEDVTAEQAAKIIICALGYEPKAQDKGGYPGGYLAVAAELGLFDGLSFADGYGAPLRRWMAAILVYNALDVPLMEVKSYGENKSSVVSEDRTALDTYHKTEKKTGVITATYADAIDDDNLEPNDVLIDGTVYTTELDMGSYVGYSADYYCTIENGTKKSTVIAFFPQEESTRVTEVNFDDVVSVNVSDSMDVSIEYYIENKKSEKNITLSKPVIMYNGKAEKFDTAKELQDFLKANMNQGRLKALKDKDNSYKDILFVENYDAYVMEDANMETNQIFYNIYTMEGVKRGVLELSKDDDADRKVFYYDEDGRRIIAGDLAPKDVLMVYASSDKKLYRIYRVRRSVEGTIERRDKVSDNDSSAPAEPKTYETVSEINFDNIDVTVSAQNSTWQMLSNGETADGVPYKIDISGNGGQIGKNTGYYSLDDISADAFGGIKDKQAPDIYNGTLLRFSREQRTGWEGHLNPARASWIRMRNIFDKEKVEVGDTLKVTAYVYTDDIWDGDTSRDDGTFKVEPQEDATSAITMYLSVERDTGNYKIGYNHAAYTDPTEGVRITDLKPHEWQEVSFEYKVSTKNKAAADLRMDASVADGAYPYARNTFIAGIRVERLTSGFGDEYKMPEDKAKYKLYIDGQGYEPVSNLYSSLINMNDKVKLMLDSNNKIVGYILGDTKSAYGLLMDVKVNKGTFKDTLSLKILDSDGELRTYETKEKVNAYDGAKVTKLDAVSLVTNQPADAQTTHYLWSTNNASQFTMIRHTWLTDEEKSKAASRKIIYYETDSKGDIHTVLVPSIPEDDPDCKIKMLHNFKYSGPGYNNIYQSVGQRMLAFAYATEKEELNFSLNSFATVYEAFPMSYDESDYQLIKNGPTAMSESNVYDGMEWKIAQLYRLPNSDTVDFMVINPCYPSHGTGQLKCVIVDSICKTTDGYLLDGYNMGERYTKKIKPGTRLAENNLVTDITEDGVLITKDMMPKLAEEKVKPYRAAYETDVMGNRTTPYVEDGNLQKGDIVRVLERGDYVVDVEVVRRRSLGVVTCFNSTNPKTGMYSVLLQYNACVRGEITEVDPDLGTVTVKGYYWTGTEPINSVNASTQSSIPVTEFTTYLKTNGSAMVYDFSTDKCDKAKESDYCVGDEIFSWSYSFSPRDIIILKNS